MAIHSFDTSVIVTKLCESVTGGEIDIFILGAALYDYSLPHVASEH